MVQALQQTGGSLGGFDWLDADAGLRGWFTDWLTGAWRLIYRKSLGQLHTKEEWDAYRTMNEIVESLPAKLRHLSTAEQLAAIDSEARKFNFKTTRERIEDELRYFLTRAGQQGRHAAAFKASPWCDHFATKEQILEQAGRSLPYKLYENDPNARLALESVISEFGSLEIHREVSPAMSQLFAAQRGLNQFDKAMKSLSSQSSVISAFQKIEPGLRDYSATLQAEINRRVNEPTAFLTPLRVRRLQRRLYYAVRRLCKLKDGPDRLAGFIQSVLKEWPYVPAGMTLDLEEHFGADNRRKLIRDHVGLSQGPINKEGRALWYVLHAIVFRDDLRAPLLRLAHKARQQAKGRRKGWQHLRKVLRVVFNHIGREPAEEEKFRNFERANFAHMRNLTSERRKQLLPELGNDPDRSVRDLTKKERMTLFQRFNQRNCTPLERDADCKNSFATRYGRAMMAVRSELGQD